MRETQMTLTSNNATTNLESSYSLLLHPFSPSAFGVESRVLILGSFPSLKSREIGFYYQHPQNRFWQVLSRIYDTPIKQINNRKNKLDSKHIESAIHAQKAFLKAHNITLWDIAKSCNIQGSSDSSMANITPNDINSLISQMPNLALIVLNGSKATEIFARIYNFHYDKKAVFPRILTKCDSHSSYDTQYLNFYGAIYSLPSTSPANARFNIEHLCQIWQVVKLQ